ncbi:MAG: mechanosensitive ion channel [Maribacter sp.]
MKNQFSEAWSKMVEKLNVWLETLVVHLPNLLIAILVFALSIMISRGIRSVVSSVLERTKLQASMKTLLAKMVSIIIVLLGLFLVLGILNLGKALNTVLAGAGVVGLAVGLALQGALANTYSGMVLSYVKHIKFGDWIETNGFEGEVIDLDLRSITLKQPDNNLVFLPNRAVVENPIKNYSSTSKSRVILKCGVGYSSDLEWVRTLVKKTILEHFESIENKEDIIFLYTEFGESSINFETRFWINATSALEVAQAKTDGVIAIKAVFDKNDITIPFPIRTLDVPQSLDLPMEKSSASD